MKILKKCLEIAYSLYSTKHPIRAFHISFFIHRNRIAAIGINNKKTSPVNLHNPKINESGQRIDVTKYTCSELNSFLKIRNKTNIPYNKLTLINVRIDRNGKIRNSCPCKSCMSLIDFMGVKDVYYTNNFGSFVKLKEENI